MLHSVNMLDIICHAGTTQRVQIVLFLQTFNQLHAGTEIVVCAHLKAHERMIVLNFLD